MANMSGRPGIAGASGNTGSFGQQLIMTIG
jgi:hypothetical protein